MHRPLGLELTRQFLWCGLVAEDRRLTFERVCQYVRGDNFETFHMDLTKGLARGLGVPYPAQQEA